MNYSDFICLSRKNFPAMKLYERYRQFSDPKVVKANIVRSVYASMALENQTVSMERIGELYDQQRQDTKLGQGREQTGD